MNKVRIIDYRNGKVRQQVVDLEDYKDFTFPAFVGSAAIQSAIVGEVVKLSYEYVKDIATFTITGHYKTANGNANGSKWRRTYEHLGNSE